jgi:hypothetical protein
MPQLGLGLGLENNILLNSISIEAQSWNTRAGNPLNATQLALFDTYFFKPMISNGLFSKFDRLNIYALNGLGNFTLALTNTIKSAHTATLSPTAPTFGIYGYAGTTNSTYLNLNYNPNTQKDKLSLNSITQFAVIRNPSFTTAARFMSARDSHRLGMTRDTNPQLTVYSTNTAGAAVNPNTTVSGNVFLAGVRSASNASVAYINKNAGTVSSTASTALPNVNVFELVENQNNGPVGPFDPSSHLASGHGQALTQSEINTLQDILNGLWAELGL